jgi:hypothetical protein
MAGSGGSSNMGGSAGGGASGTGGAVSTGGALGTGGASGAGGALGTGGAGGAVSTGGVTGTDAAIGGDAPPNTSCAQAGTPTQVWSFDTGLQGWELSGSGSMVWTGAVGDPGLGAVEVDWSGSTTHPRLVQSLGNLSGHIITAEIWVDVDANVTAKLFAQTGAKLSWGDGGVVTPTPGQWTCMALDMNNPAFSKPQFDPTNVQIIGFELSGSGNDRVYFDEIAY